MMYSETGYDVFVGYSEYGIEVLEWHDYRATSLEIIAAFDGWRLLIEKDLEAVIKIFSEYTANNIISCILASNATHMTVRGEEVWSEENLARNIKQRKEELANLVIQCRYNGTKLHFKPAKYVKADDVVKSVLERVWRQR